ncbi:MAG: hypothetical protein HQK57_02615 [Deltaproteobacteria bacterium]|nr:hypothetical protein [Deltaproteobacteria bacterium]MBF0527051.1 hypothetical protein [Deltaproteobacteria bacterium]
MAFCLAAAHTQGVSGLTDQVRERVTELRRVIRERRQRTRERGRGRER